jgi:hypothetical protein
MVDRIIQRVKFPYEVIFRRRRGSKKEYLAELAGEEPISFESITTADAEVAFRIVRHDTEQAFDIRSWNGCLWWPTRAMGRRFGVVEFLDDLKSENADSQALLFGRGVKSTRDIFANAATRPRNEAELKAKEIVKSTKYEMTVAARRQAAQIFLCGDQVFIQGTEPIYVCIPSYRKGFPGEYAKILCIDPTLRPDYSIAGVQPIGHLPQNLLIGIGEEGAIFRADEREDAEFLAAGGLPVPPHDTLEIVRGRKIDFNPVAFQIAACTRSSRFAI